ncbi:hypothetical protein LTR04_006622 [Oleoguttula sp. CCFEE 6159]|nr:hypothetical protein LTR04_006622 [Oleoguttula sp. CCFEE 6159]
MRLLDGTEYTLPGEPIWHKPFGKEICIVDVDTRIPTGINQVFNKSRLDWEKLGDEKFMDAGLGRVSAGVLNHYLYAQIHGYDYKFVQAAPKPDRGNTWVKVDAIAELLNSYRFVIFLDADAVWEHMEVPAEWLFNRWNITERTSIAMPMDVKREDCVTCDSRKRLMQNTGLIVAQQSERTQEMFAAWASCPGDERYPGCSTWRHKWAHEQRAFAEYVRYEFDRPDDVKVSVLRPRFMQASSACSCVKTLTVGQEISCYDANGYPERGRYVLSPCDGTFVRHYWVRKHFAKGAIGNAVLQSIMGRLQTQLLEQQEGILVNKTLGPA